MQSFGAHYWNRPQVYAFDVSLRLPSRQGGCALTGTLAREVISNFLCNSPAFWRVSESGQSFMADLAASAQEVVTANGRRFEMKATRIPGDQEQHQRLLDLMSGNSSMSSIYNPQGFLDIESAASGTLALVARRRAPPGGIQLDFRGNEKTWMQKTLSSFHLRGKPPKLDGNPLADSLVEAATARGIWEGGTKTEHAASLDFVSYIRPQALFEHYTLGALLDWPADASFIETARLLENPERGLQRALAILRNLVSAEKKNLPSIPIVVAGWMKSANACDQRFEKGVRAIGECALDVARMVSGAEALRSSGKAPWAQFSILPTLGDLAEDAAFVVSQYDCGSLRQEDLAALRQTEFALSAAKVIDNISRRPRPQSRSILEDAARNCAGIHIQILEHLTFSDVQSLRSALRADGLHTPTLTAGTLASAIGQLAQLARHDGSSPDGAAKIMKEAKALDEALSEFEESPEQATPIEQGRAPTCSDECLAAARMVCKQAASEDMTSVATQWELLASAIRFEDRVAILDFMTGYQDDALLTELNRPC